MRLNGSERGRKNAKRLRKELTPPEIALWLALRRNAADLRFRKQHAAGEDYVLVSTARRHGWRSKWMARRTIAAIGRRGMPFAMHGSGGRACA